MTVGVVTLGGESEGVEILDMGLVTSDGLREAVALRDVVKGDRLLRISTTLFYGVRNTSKNIQSAVEALRNVKVSEVDMIALGLLYEKRSPSSDIIKRYIDDLQTRVEGYSIFDQTQKQVFESVGHLRSLKLSEILDRFNKLVGLIQDENPDLFDPPITLEEATWALFSVSSRYFELGELERISSGPEKAYIIPIVDLLNHHHDTARVNLEKRIVDGGRYCELVATKEIRRNEPLRLSYGNWSNLELLGVYGFSIPSNPNGPKIFGVQSRSLPGLMCSLQLRRGEIGGVVPGSAKCLRQLAYSQDIHFEASRDGYFDTLPGVLDRFPTKATEKTIQYLSLDLRAYGYIHDLCFSMEGDLKSSEGLRAVFKLASRPESDVLSHQVVDGYLEHMAQAEECTRWWKERRIGLEALLSDIQIQTHTPSTPNYPSQTSPESETTSHLNPTGYEPRYTYTSHTEKETDTDLDSDGFDDFDREHLEDLEFEFESDSYSVQGGLGRIRRIIPV